MRRPHDGDTVPDQTTRRADLRSPRLRPGRTVQRTARPRPVRTQAAADATPTVRSARPDAPPAGRGRTPDRPEAARLAGLLVQLTAEVTAGRRPLAQLDRVLSPSLARRIAAGLAPGRPRPEQPQRIVRAVAGPPTPSGAVEATVVIERAGRISAIAVRLERHHGAWRATELTAPEDGYRPLPTRSRPGGRRPDAFDEAAAEAAAADASARVSPARDSA